MTDSLTEAIARAIHIESILALGRSREDAEYAADIGLSDWQAGQRGGPSWWVAFDGSMRAALAALSSIEQAGYVLMPKELTDPMEKSLISHTDAPVDWVHVIYAALLSSRPKVTE